ncbi:DUF4181 domain-containing protein [Ornithinibacillus xuwenensis]|uniref:DUF4181 domain-containing protein n=1 Tax=Ornithinibacillus xuwenensis TaxID=3144668 RepID=A0ABU9XKC7_9BACI
MFNFIMLFILPVSIVMFLISFFMKRKFSIDIDYGSRPVNNTHKWIDRILLILMSMCVVGAFLSFNLQVYLFLLIGLATIGNGLSAYMEYKYDREAKIYLIHILRLVGCLIIAAGLVYILFSTRTMDEVLRKFESFKIENIEQVEIENNAWNKEELTYLRDSVTVDKKIIQQIFSQLSMVEVRNSLINEVEQHNNYFLMIRDREIYYIIVYEEYIVIDSDYYKVVGDNGLYEMLENVELDWEYRN